MAKNSNTGSKKSLNGKRGKSQSAQDEANNSKNGIKNSNEDIVETGHVLEFAEGSDSEQSIADRFDEFHEMNSLATTLTGNMASLINTIIDNELAREFAEAIEKSTRAIKPLKVGQKEVDESLQSGEIHGGDAAMVAEKPKRKMRKSDARKRFSSSLENNGDTDNSIYLISQIVGERIRHLRKIRGYSQAKLADEMGLAFQQLQKYENGRNRISIDRLIEISKTLGAPVNVFLADFLTSNERAVFSYHASEAMRIINSVQSVEIKDMMIDLIRVMSKKEQ